MRGQRGGAAAESSCFRASHLLVVALVCRVADALLLTSQVHDSGQNDAPSPALFETQPKLPKDKRIAILLRGETFRYYYADENGNHRKPCAEEAKDIQVNATNSLVTNIIEPLELMGNHIEVLFTTTEAVTTRYQTLTAAHDASLLSGCPLDRFVFRALQAKRREVKSARLFTTGQADAMVKLLDLFNKENGGTADAVRNHFDYVMIVRTDMIWHMSILSVLENYHPDFNNVNVFRRCELGIGEGKGGDMCVLDTFWMMPTKLYPAFASCIGHDNCFDTQFDPAGNGHACQRPIRAAIAKVGHPGAFGWLEPERKWARGRSPVADLMR